MKIVDRNALLVGRPLLIALSSLCVANVIFADVGSAAERTPVTPITPTTPQTGARSTDIQPKTDPTILKGPVFEVEAARSPTTPPSSTVGPSRRGQAYDVKRIR
jgi:hypothetical protein